MATMNLEERLAVLEDGGKIEKLGADWDFIATTEQIQGRLAIIHQARSEAAVARGCERLQETLAFYASIYVLPYDAEAQTQFMQLHRQRVRIGTQDLRIAAIALSRHAMVVTRNICDFAKVPGLNSVDWSIIE